MTTAPSLHRLAARNDAGELRRRLLEDGESFDAYDKNKDLESLIYRHGLKCTALHAAVLHGSADAVRLLLEFGADKTAQVLQFERGFEEVPNTTALDLAGKLESPGLVRILRDSGKRRVRTPIS